VTDRLGRATAFRPGPGTLEAVGWIAILVLAAALRLPDLAGRGTWDADQGHDMLVLRHLVLDGQLPLLGPPTSIGDFHHGVLYYLLLAPAAFVSGGDPVAVTTWIALGGIAAVATTGWLARQVAGPWAGLVAGLVLAVSATAVEESTFIWNPNLIALSSSIALASAWRAHRTGNVRWWVFAGAAAVVTMHCHVLGVILTPVVGALLVADWRDRRRRGRSPAAGRIGWAAVAWLGLALVSYVPLAIHELGSDASELRAAAAFVTGGGGSSSIGLPARVPIVLFRVLGWPLAGLLTDALVAGFLATVLVIAIAVWRGWLSPTAEPDERTAVRWLGLGLLWTVLALAAGASSLATIVPGLPIDHYHAFADPMVVALVGIGAAALVRRRASAAPARGAVGRAAAAGLVITIVAFNLATQPPAVARDGGWRAGQAAAQRTLAATGSRPIVLASLPAFKSAEALEMPLEALGADLLGPAADRLPAESALVVLCDDLFHESIGAACGGAAEDALATSKGTSAALQDRFEAAPGRWVSVYRVSPGG
jgi:4-amino-4-deoxy-L-arabinose transferase-like glycosyltransferase